MHPSTPPRTVHWSQAPAAVLALAADMNAPRPVIGITGPVGAGKSTLANRIAKAFPSPAPAGEVAESSRSKGVSSARGGQLPTTLIIPTDNYLPDYHTVPESTRDNPDQSDLDALAHHLALLRTGKPAHIPIWSFHTHRRTGTSEVEPASLIIIEGIHALNDRLELNIAVFVDAPPDTRWQRWEQLERSGQRGWGVEKARRHFEQIAEPAFTRYAQTYKSRADILVINDAPISP
jgi:uridine kinase